MAAHWGPVCYDAIGKELTTEWLTEYCIRYVGLVHSNMFSLCSCSLFLVWCDSCLRSTFLSLLPLRFQVKAVGRGLETGRPWSWRGGGSDHVREASGRARVWGREMRQMKPFEGLLGLDSVYLADNCIRSLAERKVSWWATFSCGKYFGCFVSSS